MKIKYRTGFMAAIITFSVIAGMNVCCSVADAGIGTAAGLMMEKISETANMALTEKESEPADNLVAEKGSKPEEASTEKAVKAAVEKAVETEPEKKLSTEKTDGSAQNPSEEVVSAPIENDLTETKGETAGEKLTETADEQAEKPTVQADEEKTSELSAESEATSESAVGAAEDPETQGQGGQSGDSQDQGGQSGDSQDQEGQSGDGQDQEGQSGDGQEEDSEEAFAVLSDVTMEEDKDGAYYAFSIPENGIIAELTASMIDAGGSQVGSAHYLGWVSGTAYRKSYILSLGEGNVFGLSDADIGKNVRIMITAVGEDGKTQTVTSDSSVTLRYPSMTMPSVISYKAASVVGDLLDAGRISGLSFDCGSFGTNRIVEKYSESGWTALDKSASFSAEDEGTYRIRIQTLFGDFLSNEFKVVVPATGLTVSGELRIGNTLTIAAQGPDGYSPKQVSYSWTYAGAGAPVCTEAAYSAALKDAVSAQAVSLTVSVTDAIGNVFSDIITLAPMDLSIQQLTAEDYIEIIYDGESQIPDDARILLGDYEIPRSLYTLAPAPGKNTVKAGRAWMSVTGNSAFLTGTTLVEYRILKDEEETEKKEQTRPAETEQAAQPAPVPAPKATASADLIVTDAEGKAAAYQAKMISSQTEGEAQPVQVYEISADPAKKPDGSTLTDESGKPVYQQRHLHVSPALQKTVQERFGRMIRFVLGDGAVQLDLSALESGTAYTVKLAVLENEDLTEDEKNVLSGYGENIGTYAVRIIRDSDGVDVTDSIADTGKLEVLVRTESNEKASILFLKEKREQTQVKPVPYVADGQPVSNEGLTYVKRTAPGSGIFGLLKNQ